jgi:hypothetical protein
MRGFFTASCGRTGGALQQVSRTQFAASIVKPAVWHLSASRTVMRDSCMSFDPIRCCKLVDHT